MSLPLTPRRFRPTRAPLSIVLATVTLATGAAHAAEAVPAPIAVPTSGVVSLPHAMQAERLAAELRRPEAKLRRLHLVRPDLILYPIQFDVIC